METDKTDRVLATLSMLIFSAALGMVFFYAPQEATMGNIQRIFYFHLASAWVGFFGFFITFLASVTYLASRKRSWDILAHASTEVGLIFITMTVLSGSLWAKPVWGTYWTWEPRLTISAVQWFLYVAYVMLRNLTPNQEQEARFAAVYGVAAFATVPLSWFAIRWWRTIHPQILSGGSMALTPRMQQTLLASLIAFTFVYAALLYERVKLAHEQEKFIALQMEETR